MLNTHVQNKRISLRQAEDIVLCRDLASLSKIHH